jgi:hypothetical protein
MAHPYSFFVLHTIYKERQRILEVVASKMIDDSSDDDDDDDSHLETATGRPTKRAREEVNEVGRAAKRQMGESSESGDGMVTQAIVQWQEEKEPTAVFLHPELYGQLKKEEGWVVLDEVATEEGKSALKLDILVQLDIKANEAAFFYPRK